MYDRAESFKEQSKAFAGALKAGDKDESMKIMAEAKISIRHTENAYAALSALSSEKINIPELKEIF